MDDSREFLDALHLEFGSKINMHTVTDPKSALQELERTGKDITKSIFKIENNVNMDTIDGQVIDLHLGNILNILYERDRFERVAVLVVDYEMPELNGIEFCKKIKDRDIFKIMLTAEADKNTAINAFNEDLIDKFILKTNTDLYPEITHALHELTQRYFRSRSLNVINNYSSSIRTLFRNEIYQRLFADVVKQTNAVEYYLIDNCGSFLFLDKDANPTWFIVRNDKDLKEQWDLLKGYELPEHLMDSVAKKEKILFLFSEKEYKKPVDNWVKYIFNSKKFDEGYYYTLIHEPLSDFIDWDRVDSYSKYTKRINGNLLFI